ncbi:MAG: PspC domain-containing protein [Chloroflexota bacterium]|nr:PspC domain-containing protein [Chloroflexota bacterium]
MNERLYRSRSDRVVAGVAGGLAEIWNLDPSIVRVVWAVLVPLTGGIALLIYVVMAIIVPEEDHVGWAPPAASPAPSPAASPPTSSPPPEGGASVPPAEPMTGAEWRSQRRAERAARRDARAPRSGAVIVGVALVLVGAYFLLREYVPAFDPDRFWPIALIALGVLLLIVSMGRRPGAGGTQ